MPYFLLIETSTTVCSAAVASGPEIISCREVNNGYAHAENLTLFCEEVLHEAGLAFGQVSAIGVSSGPGSYTGLRIGLSAAKGFCFGLGIPLITVGTLDALAAAMAADAREDEILCPMIDARRMEVYTARYDRNLNHIEPAEAVIVDERHFAEQLSRQKMLFGGDGMPKCRELLAVFPNARFSETVATSARFLVSAVNERFLKEQFDDLAYSEPFYLKNFVAGKPKKPV